MSTFITRRNFPQDWPGTCTWSEGQVKPKRHSNYSDLNIRTLKNCSKKTLFLLYYGVSGCMYLLYLCMYKSKINTVHSIYHSNCISLYCCSCESSYPCPVRLLVAPSSKIRVLSAVPTPSSWTRNSVFSRRQASCSPLERLVSMESISSWPHSCGSEKRYHKVSRKRSRSIQKVFD